MRVIVNSMPNCKYCNETKEALKKHNIKYTEISYNSFEERNKFYDEIQSKLELADNSIKRTMPTIIIVYSDESKSIIPSSNDMIKLIDSGFFEDVIYEV